MKYGITIGINDYPGSGADLSGCVNDAMDMRHVLDSRGYRTATLFDQEATAANITALIEEHVRLLRYRDTLFVHFSGHGSYIPDYDGDEADGRDEVLVAHDYQNGGLITDDLLYTLFDARKFGSRIFFFSDSCNSGSVNKFVDLSDDERFEWGIEGGVRTKIKFLPPAHFLDGPELAAAKAVERSDLTGRSRAGAVLVSGCADHEYSYDAWFGSRANGAFTRTAIDTLNSYNPDNIKDWHEMIRGMLPSDKFPQTPELGASYWQRWWMI